MVFDVDATALVEALTVAGTQDRDVTVIPMGDSWRIAQRSSDSVAMVDLTLKGVCKPVDGLPTEPFGIRIDDWQKALKGVRTARVTMTPGRVRIVAGSLGTTLPLYPCDQAPRTPALSLDAEVVMEVTDLLRLTRATPAKSASAYRFTVTPEGLTVEAHDETGLGVDIAVTAADCVSCTGSASAAYPWTRWADMVRALPADSIISLSLSDDYPARVELSGEGWEGVWMVAPLITED